VCSQATNSWAYKQTRPNLPRDTYPLLVRHIRVLIYNGDWDACVPYTGTTELDPCVCDVHALLLGWGASLTSNET
jgi:hypothetical protein